MATKQEQLVSDTSLVAGIQKHMPTGTFTVLSLPETATQVGAVIQERIDKAQAVITARTALHEAVLASDSVYAQTEPFVQSVRQSVRAMYGTSPTILADFGENPRKVATPLTPAQKVIAAAKRAATRKARGTIGKKAKAEIVGALSGPVVVTENGKATVSGSSSSTSGSSSTAATPPLVQNGTSNGSSAVSTTASHS
jgi:hypothetical protein